MHKLLLGIEHLFTGIEVCSRDIHAPIRFVKESASVVAAVSKEPMVAYWLATQGWLESVEMTKEEEEKHKKVKYTQGAAEYYARKVAPRMREGELGEIEPLEYRKARARHPEIELVPIPREVDVALMNRFGEAATSAKHQMFWDALGGCWMLQWAGMLLGIEKDGYIHS